MRRAAQPRLTSGPPAPARGCPATRPFSGHRRAAREPDVILCRKGRAIGTASGSQPVSPPQVGWTCGGRPLLTRCTKSGLPLGRASPGCMRTQIRTIRPSSARCTTVLRQGTTSATPWSTRRLRAALTAAPSSEMDCLNALPAGALLLVVRLVQAAGAVCGVEGPRGVSGRASTDTDDDVLAMSAFGRP